MPHTLMHVWGPISIHSYGVMIALGLLVFTYLIKRDPRYKKLHLKNKFSEILILGIIAALIGGRTLYLISHPQVVQSWYDIFSFWEPGFSILGAVIACILVLPFYLKKINVPVIPLLDLAAIYTPLLQSISRFGCYFAGCCYGAPSTSSWAVIYTDSGSVAPLHICLHPAQLYSSFLLFVSFILLYFVLQKIFQKTGQLLCMYVLLISTERFLVDFYRGDTLQASMLPPTFSLYQYIALGMVITALTGLVYFTKKRSNEHI